MDKNQIMREAQKYAAKGMIDKAIEEWNRYLAANSTDGVAFNTVGDLYLKKRANADAITAFRTAAEIFAREGFHVKSMAVYKKVLAIEPNNADIHAAIADLESTRGFSASASEYYAKAAELYSGTGEVGSTLRCYQRLSELSPQDVALRTKLAEALIKAGKSDDGIARFLEAAAIYAKNGNDAAAEATYGRLAEIAPQSATVAGAVAKRLLQQGKAGEAVARLKPLITPDVADVDLLSSYAEICRAAGRTDDAVDAAKRAVNNDPSCIPARKIICCTSFQAGRAEEALTLLAPLLDEYRAAQDWENVLELLQVWAANAPENPDVHQKLYDAYLKLDMKQEARQELKNLGELYYNGDQRQKAFHVYENLNREDPSDSTVASRLEELREEFAGSAIADSEFSIGDEVATDMGSIGASSGAQNITGDSGTISFELENFSAAAEFSSSTSDTSLGGDISLDMSKEPREEISLDMSTFEMETSAGGGSSIDLSRDEAALTFPEKEAGAIPFSAEGLEEAAPARSSGIPEEVLAENLDEADFYVKQGFVDDARQIYEKILSLDPSNQRAAKGLAALGGGQAAPQAAPKDDIFSLDMGNESGADQSFDLDLSGEEKAEDIGLSLAGSDEFVIDEVETAAPAETKGPTLTPEDLALRESFKDFREGINQQIDAGDAETHYNLGIGYKEMGLMDEAISEFQLVSSNPAFMVNGYTMLGACYREQGRFDDAVAQLRKGLDIDGLSDDDRYAFLYEIGDTLEKQGNTEEAIQTFETIVQGSPEYRDVLDRLANLKNLGTNKPAGKNQRISYL
ncbi:MAG: tetratricopeptide repeat protein [Nitrospirota bacterium]|nr:tetratricopeptide repeat protein [Nitrospirota bacterium]